jgi:hypothetical protein
MSFAPIALFTYNRLTHLRRTVEVLRGNLQASESELIVFSDGPRSEGDAAKVRAVREYLKTITGFKSLTVVENAQNLGLAQSIIRGVTEVVNRYGRIIVLEDDLITSPYFLSFMNEALEFYQDEDRVISVLGYLYPVRAQLAETFFLQDNECWGWATWKRGWDLFEEDGTKLLELLEQRSLTRKFDINGAYPFTQILRDQIAGKNNSWAIRWQASALLHDKLTLYPGRSLVNNIGHDSSGEHCEQTSCFDSEVSATPINIERIPVAEDTVALHHLERYFLSIKTSWMQRILKRISRKLVKLRN